jgi:serine protease Do
LNVGTLDSSNGWKSRDLELISKKNSMKKCPKAALGFVSALTGGLIVFTALPSGSFARETNSPARITVQNTPVNRDVHGVTSYAPIIKRAAPSVVNIYSTRTIHMELRRMPMMPFPFGNVPPGFGDDSDNPNPNQNQSPQRPNRRGGNRNNNQTITRKEQSLGSGVIVSADGYVLTANHVVEGADPDGVKVALAASGKEFTAKIVGTDPPTDIAVLKIDATGLSSLALANSDQLEVGDVVLAIGNPFGVGQTVTMGIVSGVGRTSLGIIPEGYENFIQTDAAINQGNSGGALVDAEGRLVGINTAIFSRTGGNIGVGFAVPINLARSVMELLIKYGKVTHGYLGISLQMEISPDLAQIFKLPDRSGAMVGGVTTNTPAAKAGLKSGDVIREIDGRKIADRSQLRLLISQTPPGTKVTMKVLHSEPGKSPAEKTVTATLGTLPEDVARVDEQSEPRQPEKSTTPDSLDGVEVDNLDANVRRQLSLPADVQGALVTNVDEDSNAANANPTGLRHGDVILEINREPVRNADAAVALSNKAKGERVLLLIWRERGSFFITVDNTKKR